MLTENKFIKYILYAIGEIVLVVIGIMIALQVNNWNQIQKKLNNEIQLYSEIYNDLNVLYLDIEKDKRMVSKYAKLYSHIYSETKGEAEYNSYLSYYNPLLMYYRYSMYINEKYTKSSAAITNNNITQKLNLFIKVEKDSYNAVSEYNEHQLNVVKPFLSKHGINKTNAIFNDKPDGFALKFGRTDLIEYSELKKLYGTLEFDQLLFSIQYKTTWMLQNFDWQNENNLIFQNVLKKELELYNLTERISYWDNEKKNNLLINEAYKFYETKEYQKSAGKYKEAFELREAKEADRYNAACSYALAKDIEPAFYQLFIIVKGTSRWNKNEWILQDSDLEILHKDKRWKEITSIIKANKENKKIK